MDIGDQVEIETLEALYFLLKSFTEHQARLSMIRAQYSRLAVEDQGVVLQELIQEIDSIRTQAGAIAGDEVYRELFATARAHVGMAYLSKLFIDSTLLELTRPRKFGSTKRFRCTELVLRALNARRMGRLILASLDRIAKGCTFNNERGTLFFTGSRRPLDFVCAPIGWQKLINVISIAALEIRFVFRISFTSRKTTEARGLFTIRRIIVSRKPIPRATRVRPHNSPKTLRVLHSVPPHPGVPFPMASTRSHCQTRRPSLDPLHTNHAEGSR